MSSGTCNTSVDGGKCPRPHGHPGDHLGPATPDRCGDQGPSGVAVCTNPPRHIEDHFDVKLDVSWPKEPQTPATTVPHAVRARVELHRAQTEYDLTVLRNRIDCLPTVTSTAKELRRRREQLTAELDAWTYLSKITRTPR